MLIHSDYRDTVIDPVNEARRFAVLAHGDQHYGRYPYFIHLAEVVDVLREHEIDTVRVLQAAWLHDVLEDTNVGLCDLRYRFGDWVADTVSALTKSPGIQSLPDYCKAIRKSNESATAIKLADRIANVRASLAEFHEGHLRRYVTQHTTFRNALYSGTYETLWAKLDDLIKIGKVIVQ